MATATQPPHSGRRQRYILLAASAVGVLLFLSASWILAYRLRYDAGNSVYTHGYVGDEYLYAQRVQPLVAGATATNPINGITDPAVISPFYLEDLIRAVVSASGLDVMTFLWIWRLAFPLVLALSFVPLVLATMPDRRRAWTRPLRFAGWAAGLSLLYLLYDFVTEFPPLQGFIQRIPTNIEYPLSLLTAWACIAFMRRPDARRAAVLGAVSVALIYLRIYAALPWGVAIAGMLLMALLRREAGWKVCLIATVVVIVGCLPWMYVAHHNGAISVYQQMLKRYFMPVPYTPHPQWKLMLSMAQAMVILAWATPRYRSYMTGCALSMIVMPFICGALPMARELVNYDRFGVFYLVALTSCALLWLGEKQLEWRGASGARRAFKWTAGLSAAGIAAALLLMVMNCVYALNTYPAGPLKFIQADTASVKAYEWLREKTPADSLVLVDSGTDWEQAAREGKFGEQMDQLMARDDLFQIVARRRSVYTNRLFTVAIPDDMMQHSTTVFLCTFGLTQVYSLERYKAALLAMTPDYVLWRKTAPIPRGFGGYLQPHCESVYQDDSCVIWRVDKERLLAALRSQG